MSTATVAVITLGVVDLAGIGGAVWLGHRAIDRLRIVSPPKQPQAPAGQGQQPATLPFSDRKAS